MGEDPQSIERASETYTKWQRCRGVMAPAYAPGRFRRAEIPFLPQMNCQNGWTIDVVASAMQKNMRSISRMVRSPPCAIAFGVRQIQDRNPSLRIGKRAETFAANFKLAINRVAPPSPPSTNCSVSHARLPS
jgi:hypothetical protein